MYYFSYYDGIITVIYDFCDRVEVEDSFNVFELDKIHKWCCMNLGFPYQINPCSLSILLLALYDKKNIKRYLKCFDRCVLNNKIKIYCEDLH